MNVRRSDPETSHQASAEIERRLPRMRELALKMIRSNPGRTTNELAEHFGIRDPRQIGRRFSELSDAGLVRRETRRCEVTGRNATTWFERTPEETPTLF